MSKKSDLSKIRDKIDSLDNKILSLLNDRAELAIQAGQAKEDTCLLYTSPSPRDKRQSRMPSSA